MAADCEETRAQMLELVYGELSPEGRAKVEAHVAGCAACRAELKALDATRALARRSIAADAPPPARARVAILRAAAAALPAVPRPVRAQPKASVWAWLRGKWTLPTFATVGAVAVFLLASRIFLEPEKTYQRDREGLAPAEPAVTPARQPIEPASTPGTEATGAGPAAAEPESAPATKPAAAPARRRRAASPARADQPATQEAEAKAEPELAAPPPPAATAAGAGAAPRAFAPAPAAAARTQAFDRSLDEDRAAPAGAAAPSPAASNAKAQRAKKAEAQAEAPAAEEFAAPPPGAAPPPPPRAVGGRESAAARADRLFTQARWTEAAVAYRELLRDDPRNPDVPRWRQRLAACEAAAARSP